jgi:membrane protein implicated in regulation of membrane protease activity
MDVNTFALLGIAIAQAIAAYFTWRTSQSAMATKVAAEKTEVNTNSMREALVQRTGEAEHARGREEMRLEGEALAASLAKGKPVPKS